MKTLLAAIILFFGNSTYGQKTANIKARDVKVLKVISDNTKVEIGTLKIQVTLETKILLLRKEQYKDTTGEYTTILAFGNKEKVPLFGVKLRVKFSDPIFSVNGAKSGELMGAAAGQNIHMSLSPDHRELIFQASEVSKGFREEMISFHIKSKKKVMFDIEIDGEEK